MGNRQQRPKGRLPSRDLHGHRPCLEPCRLPLVPFWEDVVHLHPACVHQLPGRDESRAGDVPQRRPACQKRARRTHRHLRLPGLYLHLQHGSAAGLPHHVDDGQHPESRLHPTPRLHTHTRLLGQLARRNGGGADADPVYHVVLGAHSSLCRGGGCGSYVHRTVRGRRGAPLPLFRLRHDRHTHVLSAVSRPLRVVHPRFGLRPRLRTGTFRGGVVPLRADVSRLGLRVRN
mmetsp:Transcript_1965/g.5523  ORF Transcript_1965/g.5523 Transcript_1965/m.5523 type:complete len:231 (-) Transcript_1965:845-1537(-)